MPDPAAKRVRFEIGHGKQGPPVDGTVGRTGATCLVCSSPVPLEHIRSEGRAKRMGAQLMAIVAEGNRQRTYLPPSTAHEQAADVPRPADVPETEIPYNPRYLTAPNYGMTHHADLFTNRQLTALCTFSDLVIEARAKLLTDGADPAYADAIATYLAFTVDKLADMANALCAWEPNAECPRHLFGRQAIPMVWDIGEGNVLSSSSGSWEVLIDNTWRSMTNKLFYTGSRRPGRVGLVDASTRSFAGFTICTDPPYYDNIGYADLSDFFYVWMRRTLKEQFPDILSTVLTPKSRELVADPFRHDGRSGADRHFETGFSTVFRHAAEQSRIDTPMTIFYAFKQTEEGDDDLHLNVASTGWEKLLQGLLNNEMLVTGTWPMRTEMGSRMRGQRSNALASSIVLVCRPRPAGAGITDRRGFLQALKARLGHDLRTLQSGGIAPVDLAQAAIGPGMAVFSSFAKVVEPTGEAMGVRTALALINQVLDEVSAEQEGEFDEDTRWAIAWFGEYGHDDGPYGRADDLARAKNVSVEGLVRAGIVSSGAGKVRLLDRADLPADWDPTTDGRVTVWEVCQHLIRRLDDGTTAAADLLAQVGGMGDAARDLAFRLFQIAEAKKWAKQAGPYNALGAEWPELTRLAAHAHTVDGKLF